MKNSKGNMKTNLKVINLLHSCTNQILITVLSNFKEFFKTFGITFSLLDKNNLKIQHVTYLYANYTSHSDFKLVK